MTLPAPLAMLRHPPYLQHTHRSVRQPPKNSAIQFISTGTLQSFMTGVIHARTSCGVEYHLCSQHVDRSGPCYPQVLRVIQWHRCAVQSRPLVNPASLICCPYEIVSLRLVDTILSDNTADWLRRSFTIVCSLDRVSWCANNFDA